MRWFETPSFDFIRAHNIAYFFSGTLIIGSLIAIFGMGLNYGIDFRGGKEFVLEFQESVDVVQVRSVLADPLGTAPEVKKFGSDRDLLIRTDAEGEISEVQ